MNWSRYIGAAIFGLLFAAYTASMNVLVLGGMPDAFGWLKIGAVAVGAFVIGIFTYMRDPEGAWKTGPSGTLTGGK